MNDREAYALVTAIALTGFLGSYLLALCGEPQSAWLWGDVLGFI